MIPFFFLISRGVKRSRPLLRIGALWLLFMHYVDIYWMVVPSLHLGDFHPRLTDFTCWLGIGGLFLAALGRALAQGNLVAAKDPRLVESLTFENV